MTPVGAAARRRAWSDLPTVKNVTFAVVLITAVGGAAMEWGPLPGRVDRLEAQGVEQERRVGGVEADVAQLKRESGFDTCRWQDSTIAQCIHHLREP
jgi:hypothetical protein